MKRKPPRDPIAAFEREQRAARRVGELSSCSKCGEERSLALIPGSSPKICAQCQREQRGRSPFDASSRCGADYRK